MFPSTLSVAVPGPRRQRAALRRLQDTSTGGLGAGSPLTALTPALADDLRRFERDGIQTELIEVVAASMRHGRNLLVMLEYGDHVLPLTLYPDRRLMHCPLPHDQLLSLRLTDLFVRSVELAQGRAPEQSLDALPQELQSQYASMVPLCWELALRGARAELLPEIPAHAAFRIPPGVALQGFELNGTMAAAVHRMKREATNLKEMSAWAGFDRERAMRLLNGLYLQSALMATRTHPAACSDVFN
jgi:hypothetical protein